MTFDDGYSDNLGVALPIAEQRVSRSPSLSRAACSATTTDSGGIDSARCSGLVPRDRVSFRWWSAGTTRTIPSRGGRSSVGLHSSPQSPVASRRPEIGRALHAASEQWSVTSTAPRDALPLTHDELLRLAAAELVTIGAHTVDHVRLRGSFSRGAAPDHHRFQKGARTAPRPKGLPLRIPLRPQRAISTMGPSTAVRSAGFETACTTLPGSADPSTDRLSAPATPGDGLGTCALSSPVAALATRMTVMTGPRSRRGRPTIGP